MAFRCLILVYLAFFCFLSFSTRFLFVNVLCNCVGCAIPGCPIFLAINGYYGQPVLLGGTPIHYLYGYVPPIGVVILKLLIQNGVSISEAFSRTGYNISNAQKLQFCKQPFEIIQGQIALKIRFSALTSRLLYSCCTVEQSIKNWPISRKGYQFQGKFFLERGANLESRVAHTHPKNTQVPPPPGLYSLYIFI